MITIKTITPNVALPGQTLTVKINITVTGGGGVTGPVDSCLVIDRTGSMYGQKFEDAKAAAKAFIEDQKKPTDRSMVIVFSEQAAVQKDFTFTDAAGKAAIKQAIDAIIPPYGLTNLYAALQKSIQEVTARGRSDARRAILFMTDGRPTLGITSASKFVELAQSAANNDIVIYTIGLGGAGPDPVNATLLQSIANAGKGKYYFAPTSSDLEDIYLQISAELRGPPANNVRITENLPTSLVTYNNDATHPPNSTAGGVIFWQIPQILAETSWVVVFTVTAQRRVTVVQSLSPTTIIYDRAERVDIRVDLPPGIAVREVATISMAGNATSATQGNVVTYNATVANYGTIPETFSVALFANTSRVATRTVSLVNGSTSVVGFSWNTSNYDPGRYNVSIVADPDRAITGDDPTNNTRWMILDLGPRQEASILPLLMMVVIPLAIIPLVAAALLGRRRGYFSRMPSRTTRPGASYSMVCPKCYRPLTYYASHQKWYCQYCRRYV
ncbi:MAG: VWA domain-containing protein [Candidatus Bathyarchaeia archaeon]